MMFSTLFTTTFLFAIFALRVRADEIYVATVSLTQCKPATITWDPSVGPYDLIIVPASDPCTDPLVDFGANIASNTFEWDKVNLAAGTMVVISVLDTDGKEGWSGTITVQSSDDSSCCSNAQNNTSSQPSPNLSYPNPLSSTSTSSSTSPAATVVGAANKGMVGSATSVVHLSGMAVAFTAFCASVALL